MDSESSTKSYRARLELFLAYLMSKLPSFTFELCSNEREHFIRPISFAVNRNIRPKRIDDEMDSMLTPTIGDLLVDRTDLVGNIKLEDNIRTMSFRIYFIYDVAKTRVKLDNIKVPFLLYHNGNRETVPLYPFMIASIWMNRNKHHELYDLMVIHQDEIINMQYEVEERADKTDERLREMDREMNRKIDDVVARVNEVDTALNIRVNVLEYDLNMRFNKIEEKVSALEAEVNRMNVTLSALSDGMEELLKKSRAPIR